VKQYIYEIKTELNIIIRTDENGEVSCIPINLSNSDYQAYLEQLTTEGSN
jgi:hypothetical protein